MAEEEKQKEPTPMILQGVDGRGDPVPVQLEGAIRVKSSPEKPRMTLAQTVLGATDTLVYTAQGNFDDCQLIISNNDSSNRTFQIHLVAKGGSSSDSNLICTKGMTLKVAGTPVSIHSFGLRDGQMIRGLCDSASKVSVYLDGEPA